MRRPGAVEFPFWEGPVSIVSASGSSVGWGIQDFAKTCRTNGSGATVGMGQL